MHNRMIQSMAILKANWDVRGHDYIDNFVPLFHYLLASKGYTKIDTQRLHTDFKDEFGLDIPYHPIKTILVRLKNKGLVYKADHEFTYKSAAGVDSDFEKLRVEQYKKLERLTNLLVQFCATQYQHQIDAAAAESALVSFFQEHALGILSATNEQAVFQQTLVDKSTKYYVGKFIENVRSTAPETFNTLVNLAVGAALANSIVYRGSKDNLSARMKGLSVYLDTGFIFSLLGVNGVEKENAFTELTRAMSNLGIKLHVFEHTYSEVMRILVSASHWLTNGAYDMKKASRVLKYFVEAESTASDVDLFISRIPKAFSTFGISKVDRPSYEENIRYQIGEDELRKLILETYHATDPLFDEGAKEDTVYKDIESIYSICKLRKGHVAHTFNDAKHLFVTTNQSLASISKRVQGEDGGPFSTPPCITDTFIGTLIWLHNPPLTSILNEKKLLADAYAAVQPDSQLLQRYLMEVEALKQKGNLSEAEYRVLRTHRAAYNLLTEKTRNNVSNFQSNTTKEILDDIIRFHTAELKGRVEEMREKGVSQDRELEKTRGELVREKSKTEDLASRNDRILKWIATVLTGLVCILLASCLVLVLFVDSFPDSFPLPIRIIAFCIILFLFFSSFTPKKFWVYAYTYVHRILDRTL